METNTINKGTPAIYYGEMENFYTAETEAIVKRYFSTEIVNRIEQCINPRLKNRQYRSKEFLVAVCKLSGIDCENLKEIYYTVNGKMLFQNNKYFLSMSYSQNFIACYLGEIKLGVDLEYMGEKPLKNRIKILQYFTHENITSKLEFYTLWTKIESIIKFFDSIGMYEVLHQKLWRTTPLFISSFIRNNLIFAVATEERQQIKINKL